MIAMSGLASLFWRCTPPAQIKNSDELSRTSSETDSLYRNQVTTRLQNRNLKRTMDYPYLIIKFQQNDTEVELVLDPLATDLTLNLTRAKTGSIQIQQGDSTIYRDGDADLTNNLPLDFEDTLHKNSEQLTDDIIQDINLAQKLFYQQEYEAALKTLQASLQKKPTATAYALGGSIYYYNGDIDAAIHAWENALKIRPDLDEVRQLVLRYKN